MRSVKLVVYGGAEGASGKERQKDFMRSIEIFSCVNLIEICPVHREDRKLR